MFQGKHTVEKELRSWLSTSLLQKVSLLYCTVNYMVFWMIYCKLHEELLCLCHPRPFKQQNE